MRHCIRCSNESRDPGSNFCQSCLNKWVNRRQLYFDQAVSEIGPLTATTHKAITKRVKALEKEFAK